VSAITARKHSVVKGKIGLSFWIEPLCVMQPSVLSLIFCVADRAVFGFVSGMTFADSGKSLAEGKISFNAAINVICKIAVFGHKHSNSFTIDEATNNRSVSADREVWSGAAGDKVSHMLKLLLST
jgi:hypothetical protein